MNADTGFWFSAKYFCWRTLDILEVQTWDELETKADNTNVKNRKEVLKGESRDNMLAGIIIAVSNTWILQFF